MLCSTPILVPYPVLHQCGYAHPQAAPSLSTVVHRGIFRTITGLWARLVACYHPAFHRCPQRKFLPVGVSRQVVIRPADTATLPLHPDSLAVIGEAAQDSDHALRW